MDEIKPVPSGSIPIFGASAAPDKPIPEPEVIPPVKIKVGEREMTPEELAQSYTELERKLGEQGTELGTLRKRVLEPPPATPAPQPSGPTIQQQMDDITRRVQEGDLSVAEAMKENNKLIMRVATEQATTSAADALHKTLLERDAEQMAKKFYDDFPDFQPLQEQGVLDKVKAQYPLFDDVAAFLHLKTLEAFQKGKNEQATIAAGDASTSRVFARPGDGMRTPARPSKPLSDSELVQSMQDTLNKTRTSAGV